MWSLMIRSPNAEMREYPLKIGTNTIGRSIESDIRISDDSASRLHAHINFDTSNNSLILEDLESTNGTFVNGKQVHLPQSLSHQDQVRIGQHLLTVISHKERNIAHKPSDKTKSIVTSDLMIRSIDNYAVLLHDIGYQLINIPELDTAFKTISETIKRMIAADECMVILKDEHEKILEQGVPEIILQEVVNQNSATIFSAGTPPAGKTALLVPVSIEKEVVALIMAVKLDSSFGFSEESDLQLVIAVSHQVALTIQRNKVEKELLHNAYHDSLTGLKNRALFTDRLTQSLAWSRRSSELVFAVLFLDIDNFKIINDSLGHTVGDKLLIAMAQRIKTNLREVDTISRFDTIARFGGDEFAILLNNLTGERDALQVAHRLQELLKTPFRIDGKEIYITTSIGITLNTFGYDSPEDMLRDSDIAMYRAKELGKARVEIYDNVMHNQLIERLSLETELRKGLARKEFKLHYQPIISLKTGRIVGLEALLRWYSPNRGVLEPAKFIQAMDTSGLLNSIDTWVLENACRQAAQWQKSRQSNPPLFISVNVTTNLIRNPNLIQILDDILASTKIAPDSLRLEITEKANLGNEEEVLETLKNIRAKGIFFCLDDFGTGYSTLSYLMRFPIEALKVDQSFTKLLDTNPESYRIIETIKALSTHLGMSIIAEGVENKKQLELLRKLNVEYAQGFLFSKGLDFTSTLEILSENPNW